MVSNHKHVVEVQKFEIWGAKEKKNGIVIQKTFSYPWKESIQSFFFLPTFFGEKLVSEKSASLLFINHYDHPFVFFPQPSETLNEIAMKIL